MKLTIGIALLICLFGVGTFLMSPSISGQKQGGEPTPVSKGAPSDEERKFTEEFEKFYPKRQRTKLSELKPQTKDIGIGLAGILDYVDVPEARASEQAKNLGDLACKSDLIVTGRVVDRAAHLSSDETLIYTQYGIEADEIVLNKSSDQISSGDVLKLAWPGGRVRLESRTIEAVDFSYDQLDVGAKYLLFLRYVPTVRGYLPARNESDYEIVEGDKLRRNSPGRFGAKNELIDQTSFISQVKEKLTTGCKGS